MESCLVDLCTCLHIDLSDANMKFGPFLIAPNCDLLEAWMAPMILLIVGKTIVTMSLWAEANRVERWY